MPHEFRALQYQSHEVFTNILVAGGVSSVVIVLLVLYLRWKHPKPPKEPTAVSGWRLDAEVSPCWIDPATWVKWAKRP